MLTSLSTILFIGVVIYSFTSDSTNKTTKANYHEKAYKETKKNLSYVHSRDQLNYFIKANYLDIEDYDYLSLDSAKEKIARKARERGRIYDCFF